MTPKVSQEHLEQRRANILAAAKRVFSKQGYTKTTMKDVMEEAKVSRGGLYQYFSNKEDLYEALLKENLNQEMNDTALKLKDGESYWDVLLTYLFGEDRVPDDQMDPLAPSNLEFFITGRNDERRRKFGQQRYATGIALYADIFEEGQKSGEFSDRYDSQTLARSLIAYVDGLALDHAILPASDLKLKEQSEMLVEFLKMALEID
ncbi:TetR family transcriptional regulator [Halobacillus andaensis]|uniref:TetR family transcriptional regulator n=1 Tax=Halobacillus andaensis TaxID=1176239 RepID=A0A917B0T6_HALAA|nr:TetR/AcrR family transcriptional regulator [Halobacillus andaensis]MBP2003766.1 AcrR family transcriptional regulator [Halobacillus andaensis]GGF13077.1 TetR family transcriptional regulator [Halobacillus andaensis]